VIGSQGRSIFACNEQHGDPAQRITLNILLKVEQDGSVASVHIPNVQRTPLTECAAEAAQQWTFPHPSGGCATVAAPFAFGPRRPPLPAAP
jgi:hypothetical protein